MPLFLNNDEQKECIGPEAAVAAIEMAAEQWARGDAIRRPRIDNFLPTSRPDHYFCFSSMEGGIRGTGYYALRIKPDIVSWPLVDGQRRRVTYCTQPGRYGGLVLLFSLETAELVAIMNDGYVQHVRVAATAAVGVKYLAKKRASVMAILGAGGMARSFALTIPVVREVQRIQVFAPHPESVRLFTQDMTEVVSSEMWAAPTAEAAVDGADIVCLVTNSMIPVIAPEWIRPGMHVANVREPELSAEGYARIDVAGLLARRTPLSVAGFIDDDFAMRADVMSYAGGRPEERAKIPAGRPVKDRYPNARYVECRTWATGQPYERQSRDEITTLAHSSNGVLEGDGAISSGPQGIQFAVTAGLIYENARRLGLGTELPADLFLQQIPT